MLTVWPLGVGPVGPAMEDMYYLVFWQRRSTATVVNATDAAQARRLATKQKKQGYGRCCDFGDMGFVERDSRGFHR